MGGWVRMNFADAQWGSLANKCLEKPVTGYVSSLSVRPREAWTLSVKNGQMKVNQATGLFFTPFRCGSSVRLTGPVCLRFELTPPRKFVRLHFTLRGGVGLAGERVRVHMGNQRPMAVPEESPGIIHHIFSLTMKPTQSVLVIESTASEMNLAELSWVDDGPTLQGPGF